MEIRLSTIEHNYNKMQNELTKMREEQMVSTNTILANLQMSLPGVITTGGIK